MVIDQRNPNNKLQKEITLLYSKSENERNVPKKSRPLFLSEAEKIMFPLNVSNIRMDIWTKKQRDNGHAFEIIR